MKKLLALLLSLLMCFSLMVGMTACDDEEEAKDDKSTSSVEDKNDKDSDKDEDKDSDKDEDLSDEELLIGKWEAEFDGAQLGFDTADLMAEMPEEFQDIDMPALKIKLTYEFEKNGKVTSTIHADSMNDWLDEFAEKVADISDADADALKEELGEYYQEDEIDTATYRVDGDKLIFVDNEDETEMEYEVSKNKLTLTSEGTTIEFDRKY